MKAGTIVINNDDIALIYRDYYDDYTFPKGHLEEGETLLECAIRETEEECKISVRIIDENPIYIEEYTDKNNNECKCYYYLAKYNGVSDNKSPEVHELLWVNYDLVYDKLTFDSSKKLWQSIKEKVREKRND